MPDDADGINRSGNSGEIGRIDIAEWQIQQVVSSCNSTMAK